MKKLKIAGVIAAVTLLVSGCGLIDSMPELTDEESDLISEYAAGLILKYCNNYDYRVVDVEELAFSEEEESLEEEETALTEEFNTETEQSQESSTEQQEIEATDLENQSESVETQQSGVSPDTDLAPILGIDDISLVFDSYEISDSYPKDGSGFAVSASQNKKLLVIRFNITNIADGNTTVNLMDYNLSARITVNGSTSAKSMTTLLPDDLTSYYDSLSANAKTDAVVLVEISDDLVSGLDSISVKLSSDSGSVDVNIK